MKCPLHVVLCLATILAACSPASRKPDQYRIAFVPEATGQHGIFVVNSDRTGGKLLTPDATAQLRFASWSPDGKKIAFFASRDEDAQIRLKYRLPLHYPLYLMNASGSGQKRLLDFPVSSFEWSPDSRQLLLISAYEDPGQNDPNVLKGLKAPMSAVYLLNLQTGLQRRVTGFGQQCSGSWSPDGTHLALSFGEGQSSDIYTASLDGKHTQRISDSPGTNIKPVWSPDGKRIAYISFVDKLGAMTSDVYVIDSNGADKKRISGLNPYEVSWSVDGSSLLLRLTRGFALTSTDGNVTVDMSRGVLQPQDASFTPDGKEVLFRSNHEGPWYLYAVDLKGANIRRISGNLSASMYCLSPLKR